MTCAVFARGPSNGNWRRSPGVKKANVNFATRTASVWYNPAETRVESLIAAVEDVGYQVPEQPQEVAEELEARDLRKRLIVGAAFALPVVVLGMLERGARRSVRAYFAGAVLTPDRFFLRDAWIALRHRLANMNTLIALQRHVQRFSIRPWAPLWRAGAMFTSKQPPSSSFWISAGAHARSARARPGVGCASVV